MSYKSVIVLIARIIHPANCLSITFLLCWETSLLVSLSLSLSLSLCTYIYVFRSCPLTSLLLCFIFKHNICQIQTTSRRTKISIYMWLLLNVVCTANIVHIMYIYTLIQCCVLVCPLLYKISQYLFSIQLCSLCWAHFGHFLLLRL